MFAAKHTGPAGNRSIEPRVCRRNFATAIFVDWNAETSTKTDQKSPGAALADPPGLRG
jgi:hypothetical protein